jgi:hypothetical protein
MGELFDLLWASHPDWKSRNDLWREGVDGLLVEIKTTRLEWGTTFSDDERIRQVEDWLLRNRPERVGEVVG